MLLGILGGTPGYAAPGLLLAGTLGGILEGRTPAAMPLEILGGIPGYTAPELLLTDTPYRTPEAVVLVVISPEIP
jgi:hypothetical protein